MVIDHKALRRELGEVTWTSVDVKHAIALLALKVVVVMVMLHQLESWAVTWQENRLEDALIHHGLQIPVDRRNAQPRRVLHGDPQDLHWQQRTLLLLKGL